MIIIRMADIALVTGLLCLVAAVDLGTQRFQQPQEILLESEASAVATVELISAEPIVTCWF